MEDEPGREDIKDDLKKIIRLIEMYTFLLEVIKEMERGEEDMKNLLDTLTQMGFEFSEVKSRNEMMKNDESYNKQIDELERLKTEYKSLNLPAEARKIMDAYIDCSDIVSLRTEHISYFAGVRDTILFLNHLELLK